MTTNIAITTFIRLALVIRAFQIEATPAVADPAPAWYRRYQEIEREHEKAIQDLMKAARSSGASLNDLLEKEQAIRLLGKLREDNACELLVNNLSFVANGRQEGPLSLRKYPAAVALVEIGSPSFKAILGRISRDITDNEMRIIAFILYKIDGKEISLARLQLELSRRESNHRRIEDRGVKVNTHDIAQLRRLSDLIKSIDFEDPLESPH